MSDENQVQDLDDQLLARMLKDFLEEAQELLDQLNLNLIQLEGEPEDEELIDQIFRAVHTLKGSAAFAGLKKISKIARKMEEVFGAVKKGSFKITSSVIEVMYDGLDILTILVEKAAADDGRVVDISLILQKLDGIPGSTVQQLNKESGEQEEESPDSQVLLSIYKESYDQLAALKHLVYSSVHLSDPESLAVLFSKQISERMRPERNAVWLAGDAQKVVELAHDGELVQEDKRRVLEIESSEVLKRVMREQLVVWASSFDQVKELLPEFQLPIIFPIKAKPEAFGFLVLDPEESAEVEVYQFVSQFAAMILNISKLHRKVDEQRKELDEMTEILFKQNAQLSSLYHVELELMKVTDPVQLCRIVVETVVGEIEASKAAAFLIDRTSQELVGASESGGLQDIDSMRFLIDHKKPIKQSIESGRIVTSRDYNENFYLGPNLMENWVVFCLKGREHSHGVLVAEIEDEDISDPISILANYSGILLDNLMLQKKIGNGITET